MEKLERILHVDDDPDIRAIAKLTLELVGKYHVDQFGSGPEAMAEAQSCNPQLFLLDVMMPQMNGEETMRALNGLEGLEQVPTIFVTAKAEAQLTEDLISQGAIAVITKPFDPQGLCTAIENAWASHNG